VHRHNQRLIFKVSVPSIALLAISALLIGCAGSTPTGTLPAGAALNDYQYLIGPGDTLNIFVWRNPDVSANGVPVRPDGLISTPLVEDLPASGFTSEQVARAIEERLSKYIKDPLVTVTVVNFVGVYSAQIRVVGEAVTPAALPYRKHMSLLDVMLQVGGLTEFADGNGARIIRTVDGQQSEAGVRLDDLLKDGDISANLQMYPGDILIIPEAWF
jgi:polysaccharide export outer membrane protein